MITTIVPNNKGNCAQLKRQFVPIIKTIVPKNKDNCAQNSAQLQGPSLGESAQSQLHCLLGLVSPNLPKPRFEPHIGDNAWIEWILCSWQRLDRPDDQFVSGHKSCLDFVYSLWQIVTKSLNAGECVEYLGLCLWRSRRWFEGDGKMELMDDRGRVVHHHHHHNKLYKKEGSSIDHNDPSKPSHRLTNGPEPSKTIESDGSNIKKPS